MFTTSGRRRKPAVNDHTSVFYRDITLKSKHSLPTTRLHRHPAKARSPVQTQEAPLYSCTAARNCDKTITLVSRLFSSEQQHGETHPKALQFLTPCQTWPQEPSTDDRASPGSEARAAHVQLRCFPAAEGSILRERLVNNSRSTAARLAKTLTSIICPKDLM